MVIGHVTTVLTSDWSGYVALDDFEFVHSSEDAEYCTTKPASATPSTESPATPTHPPYSLPRWVAALAAISTAGCI